MLAKEEEINAEIKERLDRLKRRVSDVEHRREMVNLLIERFWSLPVRLIGI